MPIRFVLMVNKQGQTRLAQYYETMTIREKNTLESEMIRKCLARGEDQVSSSSSSTAAQHSLPGHHIALPSTASQTAARLQC